MSSTLRIHWTAVGFFALLLLGVAGMVAGAWQSAAVTGLDMAGTGLAALGAVGFIYTRHAA